MQQKTIHRYEIIEKIGEGGMGVVYKARDPRIDRLVAIKTIKFDVAEDYDNVQDKKKRFYREAKTSGQLFHQNIVTILDVDEYQDFSYIVMEYIEGETLARRLRGGQPLPEDEAVLIIMQVCDALQYAHSAGIIHRDIKPGNIMIIGQKQVKVADFGLAKMLSSESANITKTGGIVGTPFYMAPEQIRGEITDARIDIFALGVVFYECLTGEKPFYGDTISTIIYKILNEDPVCIREFNKELSPRLDDLVRKTLAKDKNDRYQTAEELGNDLRDYYYQNKSIRERTAELERTPPPTPGGGGLKALSDRHSAVKTGKGAATAVSIEGETQFLAQNEQSGLGPARTKKRWPAYVLGGIGLIVLLVVLFQTHLISFDHSAKEQTQSIAVHRETSPVKGPDLSLDQRQPTPGPTAPSEIGPTPEVTVETATTETSADFSREAFLMVQAKPAEAIISLDGSELGQGPVTRKVQQGEHQISAILAGYEPVTQTHLIDGSLEKPTTVSIVMLAKDATISVSSEPDKASVVINNKSYGQTPLKGVKLGPGDHVITLERQNYQQLSFEINLKPGHTANFSKKLVPAGYGSLNINAAPWAQIFIDDQSYQTTPQSIKEIKTGVHAIRLVHPDYPAYETTIEVPIAQNVKIYHDFEKSTFGTLQVNAIPFGTVFIDNNLEGETPISRKLSVGPHHVRISRQGSEDQIFEITIAAGETRKITADFK